ncbi:TetR/AcrR family transcriptional regulator [Williamsia sp. 1135]|uniref:TetR/AcrR family transcriptional regulator n=1 Tax=Williamsia sp. 1135 TaxID=1889262 RepID=UPI000A1167B2|nr:TetR/AcrR family transcriptional regulator [Williamsia sp. 1135]ORM26111.1 TetR family transcriptional regulator [Williamsia sp. 1135]
MRARLLDAAISCLIDKGYSGTSTQEISRRAGVSRGAQLHHFPTKESLVVAAVEHLVEQRLAELLEAHAAGQRASVEVFLDAFSGPLFYAALELWIAARTDPALHAAVLPLEARVNEAINTGGAVIFGDRMTPEAIEISVELARGLAVSALFRNDKSDQELRKRLVPIWEAMVTTR